MFYKQLDAMDCDPSCLAMIVKYYGLHPNIEDIRNKCGLNKNGVSLLGIANVAESIGFKAIGCKLSFEDLINKAPKPCIIHWNQNHFVVVYKIKRNSYNIYVADPSKGYIKYKKEEFLEHWISTKCEKDNKGIALLLEPIKDIFKTKNKLAPPPKKRVKFLWGYFKIYKRYFWSS